MHIINGNDSLTPLTSGLQILPSWQSFFHIPEGKTLGRMVSLMQRLANSDLLYLRAYQFGTKHRWNRGKIEKMCQEHFVEFIDQALPLSPFISDRFGRRMTLFTGSCLMLVCYASLILGSLSEPMHRQCGVILQGLAVSLDMFIGARVISTHALRTHGPIKMLNC